MFNRLRLWCSAWWDDLGRGGRTLGVSVMRITIDTREDSYEDALGVLRRAYGRHRLPRKAEESPAVPEAVDLSSAGAVAQESDNRSASGARRGDAGPRKPPAKATKKTAAKRTPATKAAAESPVSKSTVTRASGKKAARRAPAPGRPGGTAEAVRIRRRSQHCTARTVGGRACLGPGTRDAGTYEGADARQRDLRLPGGTQRLRRLPFGKDDTQGAGMARCCVRRSTQTHRVSSGYPTGPVGLGRQLGSPFRPD